MSKRVTWVIGAAIALTTGCDDPQASESICERGEVETRSAQTNGINLNGINLNGINLNGINLNGINLNGPDNSAEFIRLTEIKLKGSADGETAWLAGGNLHAIGGDGVTLSGADLDSARFRFDLDEGGKGPHKKTLKILDVEQLAPGSDVWLYDISVKEGPGGWGPLCTDVLGEPTQAILLGDVWEPASGSRRSDTSGAMTFACRDAALAKCVEWGYRPWAAANGQSLREYHQACSRLVRADYCGDGVAHTTHGTAIHVLDQVGVQTVDPNLPFEIEAEWGPDGAVCLNPANMRLGQQALDCSIPTCGPSFASGGLIQSGKIVAGP